MEPLFIQIAATLSARLFTSWREAARIGIAVMLLFTGVSHFSELRHEMAAMIPGGPYNGMLVVEMRLCVGFSKGLDTVHPELE